MGEEFTAVIGAVWTQFTNCVTTLKGEPMLLLPFGVGFAGAIIGITKKFFSFRR